jgi:hypothetical protein
LSTRLTLVKACRIAATRFEIVFAAEKYGRAVSVEVRLVSGRPIVAFPHSESDAGASLGTAAADALVLERAEGLIAVYDGLIDWCRFRRDAQ